MIPGHNGERVIHRTSRCVVVLAAAALLAACSGSGGGDSGTPTSSQVPVTSFSGTVTYKGSPLAGVTIVAFNTNTNSTFATTTTDANGSYSLTGFGTSCMNSCVQNFQFWAMKPGYAFSPLLANNPNGDRAAYKWESSSSTWYASTGAAVTRAGYNGQFVNASGGAGLIFTVLNFNSVANNSVSGGNFVAYDGSNPLVHLAESGQAISYAAGDDASHSAGVPWPGTRFVDNHDGTVTDALTGLIWLENAGCITPSIWSDALTAVNQLANGTCGLNDASVPGQWRMPNVWELESIVDASAANPALTSGHPFTNVSNGIYWTSTSYYGGLGGSPAAWAIRMSDGRYINDGSTNLKSSTALGVWAVKGGSGGAVKLQATGFYVPYASGDDGTIQAGVPLTFPRMRDNGDGTVTDTVTGLIWLKQANCIHQTWAGALAHVNALASGQCGLTDGSAPGAWRMPNRKEMESLADRGQNNMADFFDTNWTSGSASIASMSAVFSNFIQLEFYWTSTTNAADTNEAWTVYSCDYGVYNISKANTGYTLAVR